MGGRGACRDKPRERTMAIELMKAQITDYSVSGASDGDEATPFGDALYLPEPETSDEGGVPLDGYEAGEFDAQHAAAAEDGGADAIRTGFIYSDEMSDALL